MIQITDTQLIRFGITFIVSTGWIFGTLVISNRIGNRIGGIIGGLPSTALLSFFSIGFIQNSHEVVSAALTFPLGYANSILFLLVIYRLWHKKSFNISLLMALGLWISLAWLIRELSVWSFLINVICMIFISLIGFYGLRGSGRYLSTTPNLIRRGWRLFLRSACGGFFITLVCLVSMFLGAKSGGILAAFPIMFLSLILISNKSYGREHTLGMIPGLMLSGTINIGVFVLVIYYLTPILGYVLGIGIAFCISLVTMTVLLAKKSYLPKR